MDYAELAGASVSFLKPQLVAAGAKLVDDGLSAARAKLFDWLKGKFTKPAQSGVLEEAVQSPQDAGALETLQLQIRRALEQSEEFRRELLERLPPAFAQTVKQTSIVNGSGNQVIQIAGQNNKVHG